jgi:hypothetical protein
MTASAAFASSAAEAAQRRAKQKLIGLAEHQIDQIIERFGVQRARGKVACRRRSTRSTTSRESCCCSTRLALTDSAFARNSSSKWDLGDLAKVQDAAPVTRSSSASEVVPSANHRDPSIRKVRTFARVHASRSKGSPARS